MKTVISLCVLIALSFFAMAYAMLPIATQHAGWRNKADPVVAHFKCAQPSEQS